VWHWLCWPLSGASQAAVAATGTRAARCVQVLNERAVAVMKRMSDKLMGRDYTVEGGQAEQSHAVDAQVGQRQRT